jgi:hypothetical protein
MVGRRGEALGTHPAVVFRGLDQPFRHATPPAAASGGLSPSVYPPWDGNQPKPAHTPGVEVRKVDQDSHPGKFTGPSPVHPGKITDWPAADAGSRNQATVHHEQAMHRR